MNLAEALKTIREARGISLEELAEKMALPGAKWHLVNVLTGIEHFTRKPSTEEIQAICQALEIPPQMLLFFSLEEKDVAPDKQEVYRQLQGTIKEMILELVKAEIGLANTVTLVTGSQDINPDTVQQHITYEVTVNSPGVIPFKYDGVPFDEDLSGK